MATGGAGTGLLNVPCGAELSAPLAAPLVAPSTTDGSTVQAGGPLHAPEAADRAGTASEEPPIVPAAVAAIGDAGTGAGAPAATALSGHSAAPIGHPSVAALPAGGLNVPSAAGAAGAAASASAAAAAAAWNVPCDATDASSTAAVALNLPVPVGADAAELEHRQAAAALWVSKPPAVSAPLPLAADAPVADHKVKLVKLATDTHVSKWIVERLVLSSSLKFLCRLGSKSIACHIFDPPSQQKYHSIQLAFLRGAHAVMIAFDVTLRGDLQRARALHRDAVRIVPDVPCVFFGVRVDDTKPVAVRACAKQHPHTRRVDS